MELLENTENQNLDYHNGEDDLFQISDDLFDKLDINAEMAQAEIKKKRKENEEYYSKIYVQAKNLTKEELIELKAKRFDAKRKREKKNKANRFKEKINGFETEEQKNEWIGEYRQKKYDQLQKMKKAQHSGIKIAFDCDFAQFMEYKQLSSSARQLKSCYGIAKSSQNDWSMNILGINKTLQHLFDGFKASSWYANIYETGIQDKLDSGEWKTEDLVYLSPDAEEELVGVQKDKIYIIGGIVDGSIVADLTKNKAKDYGAKSYKLPLDKFREINNFRPALNIDTVFQILDNCFNGNDIIKAIELSLPKKYLKINKQSVLNK